MNAQKLTSESLAYRIAVRTFEGAFAACERLAPAERELLLREVGKRLLEIMSRPSTDPVKPIQVLGVEIKQDDT
jgi:hypothetical protein